MTIYKELNINKYSKNIENEKCTFQNVTLEYSIIARIHRDPPKFISNLREKLTLIKFEFEFSLILKDEDTRDNECSNTNLKYVFKPVTFILELVLATYLLILAISINNKEKYYGLSDLF